MGGDDHEDDHDSLDPDNRGARLRADGLASADPAASDVASEPSAGAAHSRGAEGGGDRRGAGLRKGWPTANESCPGTIGSGGRQ
jgi:hypothetical protein